MIALLSEVFDNWEKLNLSSSKKIAFIVNAKDASKDYSRGLKYKEFFIGKGHSVEEIDLRKFDSESLFDRLKEFDIIYVAGGNCFVLLEVMIKSGFVEILPRLLELGVHYVGQSAGACVMGASIEPLSLGDNPELSNLKRFEGLKYVDFVFLPHCDSPGYSKVIERIEQEFSDKFTLERFNDNQGVIVENNIVKRI